MASASGSASPPAPLSGAGGSGASSISSSAGGTASSSPPTSTSAGPASAAGSSGRCHTSELAGSLVPGRPGAGQRHATLVLRNTGSRTCTVYGFSGLALVDGNGQVLPTRSVRIDPPVPTTVSVSPGNSVSSALSWTVIAGPGESTSGPCQPTAASLQVIPPDETAFLTVPWDGGPVCGGGAISELAFTAG